MDNWTTTHHPASGYYNGYTNNIGRGDTTRDNTPERGRSSLEYIYNGYDGGTNNGNNVNRSAATRGQWNQGYDGYSYDGGGGGTTSDDSSHFTKGRSQSLTPENKTIWDKSRRQSAPVRWHPQYAPPTQITQPSQHNPPTHNAPPVPARPSPSSWNMTSLDTIPEDGAAGYNRRANGSYSPRSYENPNDIINRRFSHDSASNRVHYSHHSNERLYLKRSTSEGSLHQSSSDNLRMNQNTNENNTSNTDQSKKRRRKSQISFDAKSENDIRNKISDVRSVKSSRSKSSMKHSQQDYNLSKSPKGSHSVVSKGPRSTTSKSVYSTSTSKSPKKPLANPGTPHKSTSSRVSDKSYQASYKSGGSNSEATRVTFAESALDIPVDLLELRRASWKKLCRTIVVTVLVISLIASLFVAVFFASALKETQEKQIEFLQATLEFTLSQNQRSRDFSSLTASEAKEFKSAYCKQVDAWYRGSQLTDHYRGCQLDVLTNNRIEFKLFFLDENGPPKGAVEILSILEKRAELEGLEGRSLVTISDVTLDLSPSTRNVDLAVTSKPKDFIGANSRETESKTTRKPSTTTTTTTTATTTTTTTSPTTSPSTTIAVTPRSLDDTVLSSDICLTMKEDFTEVIAHPFSCGHFIQCEFGTPIARPCSGGLVFDPDTRACVKPRADLPCTEIKPCENLNGGHFAHPTNCRLFEICDQGRAVMLSCPPGLVWAEKSQNCVPKKRGTLCETDS